jgi:hypothetical protein
LNLSDRGARVVLTIAWALAIVAVDPSGNFPINDDWSYADTVRRLVEIGEWRLNPWTSMPLGTQVLWGWLFSQPAGFSFTAMRVSTLVLAWAATLGSYALLRLAGAVPIVAICGASAVMVCPVFFPLAFTFMTDVPAFALGVWALVCVLQYIRQPRTAYLTGALALLVGTTLIRQTGVALGVGGAAALFADSRTHRNWMAALALLVTPVAALLVYTILVPTGTDSAVANVREAQLLYVTSHPRLLITLVGHSAMRTYLYLGLFLLPLCPLLLRCLRDKGPAIGATAALGVSALYLAMYHVRMPAMGNVLHDAGLNPVLVARADAWPRAPASVWVVVTIAAAAAAAVATGRAVSGIRAALIGPQRAAAVLFGVACGVYLAPLFAVGGLFDRYLILPFLLVLGLLISLGTIQPPSRAAGAAALVLLGTFAIFDTAATGDFFSFSRARWMAVHNARRGGAGPDDLDGGFEVTGWLANRTVSTPHARFMVTLGELPGYRSVATYRFHRWIGESPGIVYLLERTP